MHDDGIALADAVQHAQGLPAAHEVVFGEDLEPVDLRFTVQDFGIVLRAQAKAETEVIGSCVFLVHGGSEFS